MTSFLAADQHSAAVQFSGSSHASFIKIAGMVSGRRTQCKDQRRVSLSQKLRQLPRCIHIASLVVVKDETWLQGLLRPIRLRMRHLRREERQNKIPRKFIAKHRITVPA